MTRHAGDGPAGDTGGADDGWEVIDGDDVVGTASARLLSTCADRSERLAALSLLGLLLDHADEAGRVRLPLEALARELDVEADRTVRLLQHLVAVEAVHADGDAVVVAGGHTAEHVLAPSRFLANLMTVLEREPAASPPWRTRTPARETRSVSRPASRRTHRGLVAFGVALAAMALATVPSGDPATNLRTVSPPDAPTGRAPWATFTPTPPPTTLGAGEAPANDDPGPAGGAEAGGPGSPDGGVSEVAGRPDGFTEEPSGSRAGRSGSESSPPGPTPSPERAAGEPSPPVRPPASGAGGGSTAPPDPGETCPSGTPEATVAGTQLLGVGPSNVLDVVGERVLLVTGTVANTSSAAVVAEVEVEMGQGSDRVVESVGTVPVDIAPGRTAGWEARLLAGVTLPSETPVDARVAEWSWVDPSLAARCSS